MKNALGVAKGENDIRLYLARYFGKRFLAIFILWKKSKVTIRSFASMCWVNGPFWRGHGIAMKQRDLVQFIFSGEIALES